MKKVQRNFVELSQKETIELSDWAKVWQELKDINSSTYTAGNGTKKLAESLVSDVGSLLMYRRDAWLRRLLDNKSISKQDAWDLRHTDINDSALFNQEVLDRISEKSQRHESDLITKRIWDNIVREKQSLGTSTMSSKGDFGGHPGSGQTPFKRGGAFGRFGRSRGRRGRGGRGGFGSPYRPDSAKDFSNIPSGTGKDE